MDLNVLNWQTYSRRLCQTYRKLTQNLKMVARIADHAKKKLLFGDIGDEENNMCGIQDNVHNLHSGDNIRQYSANCVCRENKYIWL